MGLFDRWRAVAAVAGAEPAPPTFEIGTDQIDPALFGLTSYETSIAPAPRISRSEAIQVPAVKRARDLIAGTLGGLPLDVLDKDRNRSLSPLLEQPESDVPRSVTMTRTVEDILFEGVAWWRVLEFGWHGYPTKVRRLDPRTVDVRQNAKVYVRSNGSNQGSAMEFVPDAELIRFDSPNDPLLVAGARAIRTALRLDTAASRYADEPMPSGYFTPAEGADPADDDDVADILTAWKTARQARSTGYVPAALSYNPVQWSPADMQLADARQHAVLEIARCAGVDPEDLGVSTTSRTYANAETRRKDLLDFTLAAYVQALQDRLSMGDVTPRGYYVRLKLDAFLRSDTKTRYEAYEIGERVGAITREEVREAEDRPPLTAAQEAAQMPAPAEPPLAAERFDEDAPMHFGFETAETVGAFEVDREKRTIYGLAVPFGPTAKKNGRTFRFGRDSLVIGEPLSRTKLLIQHDRSLAVGKLTEATAADEGLWVKFSVARGAEGDKVLSMAEDGVWDGLSVGLGAGGRFDEKDGVLHPVGVPLAEISITPSPAFDDARVSAVAASADPERTPMPDAPVVVDAPAFDVAPITDAITAGFATLGGQPEGRQVIPAGRAVVVEPAPYRFDGGRSAHDFSSDLINSLRNRDPEASQRIDEFMAEVFDVDTADVNELSPNRQRPDLYVDNLEFQYPIWSAINKGTLPDATPFTLPKFNTATGMVAAHVEGVAPTPGTFTTTGQTITPSAVSGRYEITREVWDQGGNPQFSSILWREITRAYYEALEVAAVDMLDALTPTAIALNGVDADLDNDVATNLAALAYIRGGNRFRDFYLASNLFTALVTATDDMGRRLYPVLSPQNASGSTEAGFGQILVGGMLAKPAWALESGNGGDGSSYLFNRDDVHGWATPPRRFDFEYRVEYVDLAVFGYKAFANTRLAGVREVTYSAT